MAFWATWTYSTSGVRIVRAFGQNTWCKYAAFPFWLKNVINGTDRTELPFRCLDTCNTPVKSHVKSHSQLEISLVLQNFDEYIGAIVATLWCTSRCQMCVRLNRFCGYFSSPESGREYEPHSGVGGEETARNGTRSSRSRNKVSWGRYLKQHAGWFFSLVPPSFSTKKKTPKQPITAFLCNRIYWNSGCDWLNANFLFGIEIGGY